MKCSVLGTNILMPVTQKLYNERYNTAEVVHGVNFKKSFIDMSWDCFQNNLSWLLLNSLFSIYEGFLASIKSRFRLTDTDIKNLQFPTKKELKAGKSCGVKAVIMKIQNQNTSSIMNTCFYQKYKSSKNYPNSDIDNLLKCYRYFKELRNCYIHNNIIATKELKCAYDDYEPVKNLLGMKKELLIAEPIIGNTMEAYLYGVIGFSDVILKMLYYIDAEILKTNQGELHFKEVVTRKYTKKEMFSSDKNKCISQINHFCMGLGFMCPENPLELKNFLQNNGLHL